MFLFNKILMNLLGNDGAAGAGGTPPSTSTPPPTSAPPPTIVPGAWDELIKTLPDDLKADSSMATIKDFPNLVKSYINAQKMVGGKVNLPDPKHATEADYIQIMKKMGVPDKLEDYKVKLPDGVTEDKIDKEFFGKLKETALASGILPWQFEKLYNNFYSTVTEKAKTENDKYAAEVVTQTEALKKEWGQGFDTQVKKANVAFKELVPNEADRTQLINDGLGGHPVVMKILANAAKYFKEDTFIGHGAGEFSGITPEQALSKARDIQGNPTHPYRNPTHPNHAQAKKEVQDLYKIAYPENN